MGAMDGSITYRLYHVNAELPGRFRERFLDGVKRHAFDPLTVDGEADRSVGWVNIRHPLDSDFRTHAKFIFNEYLCLGLRMDRWSIPSTLLKAHLKEAVKKALEESDRDRLGRRERQQLKEAVVGQLKQRLMPGMRVVDMVWNLDQQTVRFWSHSKTLGEEFMALFEQTFGLSLLPSTPYTAAVVCELDDAMLERFTQLQPQDLTRAPQPDPF